MIRQGVTTMVLGESRSAGPVKPGRGDDHARRWREGGLDDAWWLLQRLERQHMATNIASYVGEEQVWTYVKGYDQSPGDACRTRGDEDADGAGDGGGRDGPVDRAADAAVEPGDDRRT